MRILEAKAIISAADKTGGVFRQVAQKIRALEGAASKANRQSAMVGRSGVAAMAMIGRYAAPAALAAGAVAATKNYAAFDRQLTYLGITAQASGEQLTAVRKAIAETAKDVAETPDEVLKGTQTFIAALGDLDTATKATRDTARSAKAFGADISEQAGAGVAVVQNLSIEVEKLGRAYDIMAAGANIGMFEAKDMAKHLPMVTAAAKELGVVGEKGLGKLVTHLEIARTATGDSSTAANDYYNLLQKITSNETIDRFEKLYKVDLVKEIKQGYKSGTDAVETFLNITRKVTGGDPFKMKELVTDQQANRALTALIANWDKLDDKMKTVLGAEGLTDNALARVLADTQARLDRFNSSWDRMLKSVGILSSYALSPVFDAIAEAADNASNQMESPGGRAQAADDFDARNRRGQYNAQLAEKNEKIRQEQDIAVPAQIAKIDEKIAALIRGPLMRSVSSPARTGPTKWEQKQIDALEEEKRRLQDRGSKRLQDMRMARFEFEQRQQIADMAPLPGPTFIQPGAGNADRDDRMAERAAVIAAKAVEVKETKSKRRNVPLPAPVDRGMAFPGYGDDSDFKGSGGAIKAVLDGPVKAEVSGKADVKVTVEVKPSPQLLATVQKAEAAAMKLNSAPTGQSMQEAEPPSGGSSGGIGAR